MSLHGLLEHIPRVFLPPRVRTENFTRVMSPIVTGSDLDQLFRNCGLNQPQIKRLFDDLHHQFGDRIEADAQSTTHADTVQLWNEVFLFIAERVKSAN
jgi:hypothetical protein